MAERDPHSVGVHRRFETRDDDEPEIDRDDDHQRSEGRRLALTVRV